MEQRPDHGQVGRDDAESDLDQDPAEQHDQLLRVLDWIRLLEDDGHAHGRGDAACAAQDEEEAGGDFGGGGQFGAPEGHDGHAGQGEVADYGDEGEDAEDDGGGGLDGGRAGGLEAGEDLDLGAGAVT